MDGRARNLNWDWNCSLIEIWLGYKRMVVLKIKVIGSLIGMIVVYAKLIAELNADKKVHVHIHMSWMRFMSLFGKPLGCLIFFWVEEGLERRVGVWAIDQYKGGAGEIFRKVKVLENFQDFWKFSLIRIN